MFKWNSSYIFQWNWIKLCLFPDKLEESIEKYENILICFQLLIIPSDQCASRSSGFLSIPSDYCKLHSSGILSISCEQCSLHSFCILTIPSNQCKLHNSGLNKALKNNFRNVLKDFHLEMKYLLRFQKLHYKAFQKVLVEMNKVNIWHLDKIAFFIICHCQVMLNDVLNVNIGI